MAEYIEKSYAGLGTINQFKLWGNNAEKTLEKIVKYLYNTEQRMSYFIDSSEISSINKSAGTDYVRVSEDTFYVIKKAKEYAEITNGLFDITSRPLSDLWSMNDKIPNNYSIDKSLELVNWEDILLKPNTKEVMLARLGQKIDLGAIGKGFIADEIVKIIKCDKISAAIVNLGGDVFIYGNKPDNTLFEVGLQDPFSEYGESITKVKVKNRAVATSGIYERYNEKVGQKAHHIIDPRIGHPVINNIASVTVATKTTMEADVYATAILIMGIQDCKKFLKKVKDIKVFIITKDKQIHILG